MNDILQNIVDELDEETRLELEEFLPRVDADATGNSFELVVEELARVYRELKDEDDTHHITGGVFVEDGEIHYYAFAGESNWSGWSSFIGLTPERIEEMSDEELEEVLAYELEIIAREDLERAIERAHEAIEERDGEDDAEALRIVRAL